MCSIFYFKQNREATEKGIPSENIIIVFWKNHLIFEEHASKIYLFIKRKLYLQERKVNPYIRHFIQASKNSTLNFNISFFRVHESYFFLKRNLFLQI